MEQGSKPSGAGSTSLSGLLDHALKQRTYGSHRARITRPRAFLARCFRVPVGGHQLLQVPCQGQKDPGCWP